MTLEDIYKKVSAKHNVPEECARQIHMDFWKGVKRTIEKDTAKDIVIAGFGSIYLDPHLPAYELSHQRERFRDNEEYFLQPDMDWMTYLYRYRSIITKIRHMESLLNTLEKRKNRKKGERGL